MRHIISIQHIEFKKDKNGRKYSRTHATLDDGTEAIGFGKDFDVNDMVEVFHHSQYDQIKMRKRPKA